ncbi:GDSL esterase/lipase, partial [Frankliniella fusca]
MFVVLLLCISTVAYRIILEESLPPELLLNLTQGIFVFATKLLCPLDRSLDILLAEWRHVLELDHLVIELVAVEHSRMHGCTVCHGLVRVDGLAQILAAKHVPEQRAHLGDASRAAHQHHVVDLAGRHLREDSHENQNALAGPKRLLR